MLRDNHPYCCEHFPLQEPSHWECNEACVTLFVHTYTHFAPGAASQRAPSLMYCVVRSCKIAPQCVLCIINHSLAGGLQIVLRSICCDLRLLHFVCVSTRRLSRAQCHSFVVPWMLLVGSTPTPVDVECRLWARQCWWAVSLAIHRQVFLLGWSHSTRPWTACGLLCILVAVGMRSAETKWRV